MRLEFAGKTVVVTGAGRGIGRAAALAFADHGGQVAALDVDLAAAVETADLIQSSGGAAHAWECDVSQEVAVRRTVGDVIARFAAIDVLFNNAGVNRRIPLAD